MKSSTLLLVGSLVANVALATTLLIKPELAPPAFRGFFDSGARSRSAPEGATSAHPSSPAAAETKAWPALQSDDYRTLIERLRAAGFPASVIRAIISAQIAAKYDARMRAITDPDPNVPFWKTGATSWFNDQRMVDYRALMRERSTEMRDLFRDEFFKDTNEASAAQRRRYGNLSQDKIDQIQRVTEDYDEMIAQVRAAMQGVALPEDREKLAFLEREKRADLAAMLTPQELEDYEMRSSAVGSRLRNQVTAFNATEDEYRAIFRLHQAASEQINPSNVNTFTREMMEQRAEAQKRLNEQIKAALGEQRYAEYLRSGSREYQQLLRIAERENLQPSVAAQAYTLRDQLSRESQAIVANEALSDADKRTALQSLAQNTRAQLLSTLGAGASGTYMKIAEPWLGQVERGSAVTFTDTSASYRAIGSPARPSGGEGMIFIGGGGSTPSQAPASNVRRATPANPSASGPRSPSAPNGATPPGATPAGPSPRN